MSKEKNLKTDIHDDEGSEDLKPDELNLEENKQEESGNSSEGKKIEIKSSADETGNISSDKSEKKPENEAVLQKTPEECIVLLEEEVALLKDKLLRKQADYENFRKRLFREKEDSLKYANQMLLLDVTAVIDDFERAIKSSEESRDFNALHDGIVLIEKQLVSMLEKKWGLKRFDSVGEVFDPDRHLAIAVDENGDVDNPTVIEDYQKGYLFHERVLRPAKVKVAQPVDKDEKTDNNK